MKLTQPRLVAAFFLLAVLGGWTPFVLLLTANLPADEFRGFSAAAYYWHMFPPLLAALFLTGPVLKRPVREALGITFGFNRFWGLAWLTPTLLLLVGLGFGWLLSGVEPIHTLEQYIAYKRAGVSPDQLAQFETNLREHPPGHPFWLIVRGLPASLTINLLPALALEAGFRGFLFREMPGGYWQRSLRIGVLFGLYMAPSAIFHFADAPLLGALAMFAFGVLLTPSLVYLRVRAGSVMAVALFWSMLITLTRTALDLSGGAPSLLRPFFGAGGILAVAVLLGALAMHDRYLAEQRLMTERARPAG